MAEYGGLILSTIDNAKDTLCRNVLIYGHCRYEDQGCSFNHEPNSIHGSQAELYVLFQFYIPYPGGPKAILLRLLYWYLVRVSFGLPYSGPRIRELCSLVTFPIKARIRLG